VGLFDGMGLSDLNTAVNGIQSATQSVAGGVQGIAGTVRGVQDFFNGVTQPTASSAASAVPSQAQQAAQEAAAPPLPWYKMPATWAIGGLSLLLLVLVIRRRGR
jgi:hypothetical protein